MPFKQRWNIDETPPRRGRGGGLESLRQNALNIDFGAVESASVTGLESDTAFTWRVLSWTITTRDTAPGSGRSLNPKPIATFVPGNKGNLPGMLFVASRRPRMKCLRQESVGSAVVFFLFFHFYRKLGRT